MRGIGKEAEAESCKLSRTSVNNLDFILRNPIKDLRCESDMT